MFFKKGLKIFLEVKGMCDKNHQKESGQSGKTSRFVKKSGPEKKAQKISRPVIRLDDIYPSNYPDLAVILKKLHFSNQVVFQICILFLFWGTYKLMWLQYLVDIV